MTRKEMLPELSDLVFKLQEKGYYAMFHLWNSDIDVTVYEDISYIGTGEYLADYTIMDGEDELYTECIDKLKTLLQ
jgi:hypothetical protein